MDDRNLAVVVYLPQTAKIAPNIWMIFYGISLVTLNKCMNYKDTQQRTETERWLKANGINVAHIYVGTTELFEATKLATVTLKEFGRLLEQNQAQTLNNFLKATRSTKTRDKITQGQCYKVMNIAKQAQRKSAKFRKLRK